MELDGVRIEQNEISNFNLRNKEKLFYFFISYNSSARVWVWIRFKLRKKSLNSLEWAYVGKYYDNLIGLKVQRKGIKVIRKFLQVNKKKTIALVYHPPHS